jgi:hypothetical protein
METAVRGVNDAIGAAARGDETTRDAVRRDLNAVNGMARFDDGDMPWHADRPALAAYAKLAADAQLPATIRDAASTAHDAVAALVVAHKESPAFAPYDGTSYRDAVGPTVHLPTSDAQVDPWAPHVRETNTAFFKATHGSRLDAALA